MTMTEKIKQLDEQRQLGRWREDSEYIFEHHRETHDIISGYLAERLTAGEIIGRFKGDHKAPDNVSMEPRLLQRKINTVRYLAHLLAEDGADD